MSIKENIETHPVVWFLSSLLAGFLAGIATYKSVLDIAHLEVVAVGKCAAEQHESVKSPIKAKLRPYTVGTFTPIVAHGLNFAISFHSTKYNYDPKNKAVQFFISYPMNPNIKLTDLTFFSTEMIPKQVWVESSRQTYFSLGDMGTFVAQVKDITFDDKGEISRILVDIGKDDQQ